MGKIGFLYEVMAVDLRGGSCFYVFGEKSGNRVRFGYFGGLKAFYGVP